MTPAQLAKSGTEHGHQRAIFCWAQQNTHKYPALDLLFAIPNGGKRDKITAGKLKAEGVKAGVPDICLAVSTSHSAALYIELKRPKDKGKAKTKGVVGNKQAEWSAKLIKYGNAVCVAYGWEHAVDILESYLSSDI